MVTTDHFPFAGEVLGTWVMTSWTNKLNYISIVVTSSLPTFQSLSCCNHLEWMISCTTVAVIPNPKNLLVVADKAYDSTVDTFISVATIGQISCPVLEGRVLFTTADPRSIAKRQRWFVNFFYFGTWVAQAPLAPDLLLTSIDEVRDATKFVLWILPSELSDHAPKVTKSSINVNTRSAGSTIAGFHLNSYEYFR